MPDTETLLRESKDRLTRMVSLLGFEADITAADLDGVITLNLKTEEAGRLIGRKGHCLQSLELLLDRMLRKQHETCPPLEIVIDGIDQDAVARAMAAALRAAAGGGVVAIGAGNYGGKLGKYHFHLHSLV